MTNTLIHPITPNATTALRSIYLKIISMRSDINDDMHNFMINYDGNNNFSMWDDLEIFCAHSSDFSETDLQDYFFSAENLLCALDFYIHNRNWFEDFADFKISKHMTTKIRKVLYNVVF